MKTTIESTIETKVIKLKILLSWNINSKTLLMMGSLILEPLMTHVMRVLLLIKDHIDETMSSNGLLDTSTSSNTYKLPKNSKLSNMHPLRKEPNSFHIDHSYHQGLPLKETQANLHLDENLFHATKTKDLQISWDAMLTIPTLANPWLSLQDTTMWILHTSLSLEVVPCQEESQQYKVINKDQNKSSFHILQHVTLPYPISYPPPKYDEDTTSTTSIDICCGFTMHDPFLL